MVTISGSPESVPTFKYVYVIYTVAMANNLLRAPDENSGPALMGREPVLLPEQRKEFARSVRDKLDM